MKIIQRYSLFVQTTKRSLPKNRKISNMKYTTITLPEMTEFLGSNWSPVRDRENNGLISQEHVMCHFLTPEIVVKVYTSISKNNNVGRSKGSDAIRVCAIKLTRHPVCSSDFSSGWIRSTKVLRVEGWRTNLHRAIINTIRQAQARCERLNNSQRTNFIPNPNSNPEWERQRQQIMGADNGTN
jgi:hypothetical protein